MSMTAEELIKLIEERNAARPYPQSGIVLEEPVWQDIKAQLAKDVCPEFPTINEWLDKFGIDRAYRRDMKETYLKEKEEACQDTGKATKLECYVQCSNCGAKVSNTVISSIPEGLVVRAFVECVDCIAKAPKPDRRDRILKILDKGYYDRHDELLADQIIALFDVEAIRRVERERIGDMLSISENDFGFIEISNHVPYENWQFLRGE